MRAATLVALGFATLAARSVARVTPAASPVATLPPSTVLARYADALLALPRPHALSFEYTVEQLGLHNIEQTHRVYRSGLDERDETLVVDGYALKRPSVRILSNRTNRYDIAALAPKAADYAFRYIGRVRYGDEAAYAFATEPRVPGAFAVTEVDLDAHTYLPAIVRFAISGGGTRGSGTARYARTESYWLVRDVRVEVHLASGALAREQIVWTAYQFPASLPPSTFQAPRPVVTPPPTLAPP